MSKTQYLHEQAAKAERLRRSVGDALTIERLTAFAAECRSELAALAAPANQFQPSGGDRQ